MNAGSIRLTFASDPDETITPATARVLTGRYRKTPFRAPYGMSWHYAGHGLQEPVEVALTIHAHGTSISAANATVNDIVSGLRACTHVTTPFGRFTSGGLTSVTQTPDALGYRIDAIVVATSSISDGAIVLARRARASVTGLTPAVVADAEVAGGVLYGANQVVYGVDAVVYGS